MASPPLLLLWTADPKVVRALEAVAGEHGLAARRSNAADPAESPAVVVLDLDAPGALDTLTTCAPLARGTCGWPLGPP